MLKLYEMAEKQSSVSSDQKVSERGVHVSALDTVRVRSLHSQASRDIASQLRGKLYANDGARCVLRCGACTNACVCVHVCVRVRYAHLGTRSQASVSSQRRRRRRYRRRTRVRVVVLFLEPVSRCDHVLSLAV
jgi:hypothetical protein